MNTLTRAKRRLSSLRGVAPTVRWPTAKRLAAAHSKRIYARAIRRATTGQVRLVQLGLGPQRANAYFWHAPTKEPTWFDVQRRIERLAREHPGSVEHFVLASLEHTGDPVAIVGMARHPMSRDIVRTWLQTIGTTTDDRLQDRFGTNRLLGAAVVAAAGFLLQPDEQRSVRDTMLGLYQLADRAMFQFIDSTGTRPFTSSSNDESRAPSGPARHRHRLVVAATLEDRDAVALLLPDADRVTLVELSDTFGRADFAEYEAWPDVGVVDVEHIRSRITRFSPAYASLHRATSELARRLSDSTLADLDIVHDDDRRFLEVEIADVIFFQALQARAVEQLLADQSFDHIVIAFGPQGPTSEYVTMMSGVRGLVVDPRVEFVSISRSSSTRSRFWEILDRLEHKNLPPHVTERTNNDSASREAPDALLIQKFDESARRVANALIEPTNGPWVLVATANNAAYNEASAGYVHALGKQHDVAVLHVGQNATQLADKLSTAGAGNVPLAFLVPEVGPATPIAERMVRRLAGTVEAPTDDLDVDEHAAAWAALALLPRLSQNTIAPALARYRALRMWFDDLERRRKLPAAVVLTPNRNPGVSCLAPIARSAGIPSVVLEPHMQDANYCRYVKVSADYYGVISNYFREHAARGFGIDSARTVSIGSPRLVAPQGYDHDVEQTRARRQFTDDYRIGFPDAVPQLLYFCQPSSWDHVSRVWGNVIDAARQSGARVLLKPHPEESPNRIHQYLDLAVAHGAADIVTRLECDPATAIALADLVLTTYSTAAIDAAIRQVPVICVADGDVSYPIDLPAIVGAPVARNAAELADLVNAFLDDPTPFDEQAKLLIERESQFVDGPGPHLLGLLDRAVSEGRPGLRSADDIPASLFLDGPHPTFPV